MKSNYLILPVILITIVISNLAAACICIKMGDDFFDTVNRHNIKIKNGQLPVTDFLTVFTGEVIKYQDAPIGIIPASMLVKVKQIIQGSIPAKSIWVYGDYDGMQCRPPITAFHLNANYIFAANQDANNKYYISSCGYYYSQTKSPSSA